MLADADLAAVADLMTANRAALLLALAGGGSLSAGELASRAGISPSLASSHLSRLLDGGLIAVQQDGRRRHYRLAGPHVAEVVEAMLTLAPHRAATSLRESRGGGALARARTCYDHLAGAVGVALTDSLQRRRVITATDNAFEVTRAGERRLESMGLDLDALRDRRRAFARPCDDWTERRPHLAGALGAAIAETLIAREWFSHLPGTRALRVTDAGRRGLFEEFGLNPAQLS